MEHPPTFPTPLPDPAPSPDNAATRRRFLKGTTLALPVVMTLNSVAAQATARSSLSCAEKDPPTNVLNLTEAPDGWYRQEVKLASRKVENDDDDDDDKGGKGSKGSDGDDDDDDDCEDSEAKYFKGMTCGDSTLVWMNLDGTIANPQTGISEVGCDQKRYALCHFSSADGSLLGYGETAACAGSFITSASGACLKSLWGTPGGNDGDDDNDDDKGGKGGK
jgi:hypothetical protein